MFRSTLSLFAHTHSFAVLPVLAGLVAPAVLFALLASAPLPAQDVQAQNARVLTLRESIQLALAQNADLLLARLDQQAAEAEVNSVADPRSLKLGVGSGLAYSSGFPMNVGGSGPSIVNAQASMTIFDRPLELRVAEEKARVRIPAITEKQKRADIALEVARLYLDAEALAAAADSLSDEISSMERVAEFRAAEEREGLVLPLEVKRSAASLAAARYRMRNLRSVLQRAQATLGYVLGLPAGAAVLPARETRERPPLPESLSAATQAAIVASVELERIDAELAANQFRVRAASATHWPVVKLVAQYSMFSRFNNYDDFYNRFERHNGQIGASFELPLFTGSASKAARTEADIQGQRLRLQADQIRRKLALDTGVRYREVEDAAVFQEAARLELEVAREDVSVVLARVEAGKARPADLELARANENRKWVDYYQSRAASERALLELLHQTGDLVALFR